eukprot:gene16966-22461_t
MSSDIINQLEEKMLNDLKSNHPYEAQQYVQSFLSRKKKTLGQNKTSSLVFHGAKLLIDYNAPNDAASKAANKSESLSNRLIKLEEKFANIFEDTKKWHNAYKSVVRLNDHDRLAKILNQWSSEGYKTEQPLFFARAVFNLLADKKIDLAIDLISKSSQFIVDNVDVEVTSDTELQSGALATWHLAIILAELAKLPPLQRVDKTKLFGTSNEKQAPNPMKLFQNMLSAGANPTKSAPPKNNLEGIDMNSIMAMLNQVQGK